MKERGKKSYTKYTAPITEGGPIYGAEGPDSNECETLSFATKLQKPQSALAKVLIRDYVFIEIANEILIAVDADGNTCGSVASPFNDKLLKCIKQGYKYRGKILSTKGDVRVEPMK